MVVKTDKIDLVQTLSNFPQLMLILFIIKSSPLWLYRLEALGLPFLRHQDCVSCIFLLNVVEWLSLNYLLLEQQVVVGCCWVMHMCL